MIFGPSSTVTYTVNGASFSMVRLPPGRFMDGEGPGRRELLVSRPFELGLAPVTQVFWQAVMRSSPSYFNGEDRPVESVSIYDVKAFLDLLSSLGLTGFRLPTEAEWAWAARCGAPTRLTGGDRASSVAVIDVDRTGPVAGLQSNPAGIFDQSGNVWEWIADPYQGSPASGIDPVGSASGSDRVFRGSSWFNQTKNARIIDRYKGRPVGRYNYLGFRLVRTD